MTFDNTNVQYRVTLNTDLNLFIVFDKNDHNHVATGVTIEKAVQELQKNEIGFQFASFTSCFSKLVKWYALRQ